MERVSPRSGSKRRVSSSIAAAVFPHRDLALGLHLDRLHHEADRVEVLDLAAGAQLFARPAHRDVDVGAQRALLHVAVAGADVAQDGAQLAQVEAGFLRAPDVGLGDDLHQRDAGAVEVDAGGVRAAVVDALAGVHLQVQPGDADGPAASRPPGRARPGPRPRWAASTARSDSPAAGRGRSSSCGRTPRSG